MLQLPDDSTTKGPVALLGDGHHVRIRLGSAESNFIRHDGHDLDRVHLELFHDRGHAWVRSLATRFATWVNGEAIPDGHELRLDADSELRAGRSYKVGVMREPPVSVDDDPVESLLAECREEALYELAERLIRRAPSLDRPDPSGKESLYDARVGKGARVAILASGVTFDPAEVLPLVAARIALAGELGWRSFIARVTDEHSMMLDRRDGRKWFIRVFPTGAAKRPAIEYRHDCGAVVRLRLRPEKEDGYQIGRVKRADIKTANPAVSRRHCRIYAEDGDWLLEDSGSSGGTWVGDEDVGTDIWELRAGDVIRAGDWFLTFVE